MGFERVGLHDKCILAILGIGFLQIRDYSREAVCWVKKCPGQEAGENRVVPLLACDLGIRNVSA